MDFELLVICAVLGASLLPLLLFGSKRVAYLALGIGAIAALGVYASAAYYRAATFEPPVRNRPIERNRDAYVSSDSCRPCHPQQYATWYRSWHRTMTQVATPESVIADFEGETPSGWNPRREGDTYWLDYPDPERRERVKRPIVMTTGSHHMQVYWFSMSENGRGLGQLPFAYLKQEKRWVPLDSVFIIPEGRLENGNERWNHTCIHCHTTRPAPRYTPPRIDSRAVEFGIACEACHGPGQEHVQANRFDPARRYGKHLSDAPDETIVHPGRLSKERSVEVCGQCHGVTRLPASDEELVRANIYGYRYQPGDVLDETGRVTVRGGPHATEPRIAEAMERVGFDLSTEFWPDGMVRVARELNGLLESPCYTQGDMSCLSCHTMHKPAGDPRSDEEWADDQLLDGMRGDAACLQCHSNFGADLAKHTQHAPESDGSRCQNCHMPYTAYGLLKAMRQHEIDVPTVAASVEAGRPNACNACHLDQTLAWSAAHLNDWYGQPEPALDATQREVAASVLWAHTGNAAQRALVAWYAGWEPAQRASGTDWLALHVAQLLEDPYAAVRFIAWRSLRTLPASEGVVYDHLGAAEQRGEAKRAIWRRAAVPRKRADDRGASLLLFPDGALDRLALKELLEQRDDRPMYVGE